MLNCLKYWSYTVLLGALYMFKKISIFSLLTASLFGSENGMRSVSQNNFAHGNSEISREDSEFVKKIFPVDLLGSQRPFNRIELIFWGDSNKAKSVSASDYDKYRTFLSYLANQPLVAGCDFNDSDILFTVVRKSMGWTNDSMLQFDFYIKQALIVKVAEDVAQIVKFR